MTSPPTPEERFQALWARHGAAVARLARSYGRTREGGEDLLQDIVLALWRAWPSFRQECSERAFVLRVAHNRALTHAWRRPPPHEPLEALPEERQPVAGGQLAEQAVLERERTARLHQAVRALPLNHREVILLMLEDLSHAEMAEVLGITENNVAVRLTRARAALREALEP